MLKTKNIITYSFFAAFICIFSCVAIPVGAIPVSFGIMAIILTALILGRRGAFVSTLVYILLGAFGLPVFSGLRGGFQVLFGPTGGYIWSYLIVACVAGFAKAVSSKAVKATIVYASVIICYFFGSVQFAFVQDVSFGSALAVCVYPFALIDALKVVGAVCVSDMINRRIKLK